MLANVLFVSFAVYSLQCYSCTLEDNPDALKHCELPKSGLGNNTVVSCSSGEDRCIIVKTFRKDGTVTTFRRSCSTVGSCSNNCASPDPEGTAVCDSCCEDDLCNKGEGPKASEVSGTSRLTITMGLFMSGGFLVWFLL